MPETDEAYLARLTVLARLIWHDEDNVLVARGMRGTDPYTAFVHTENGVVLDIAAPNGGAMAALEAALLVLKAYGDGIANQLYKP